MKETTNKMIILLIAILIILGVIYFINSQNKHNSAESQRNSVAETESNTIQEKEQVNPTPNPTVQSKKQYSSAPQMAIDTNKKYQALLKTNKGDIKVDLFANSTPITVNNFVFLANEGFYNQTKFHRIIKDFMIQGGDPQGTGMGGPGYRFDDEPFTGEYEAGTIAMANAGPNTNGSQFFIMHKNYPLPKNYVIFGKASDPQSLSVIDTIANTPTRVGPSGEKSQPMEDIILQSVTIITE